MTSWCKLSELAEWGTIEDHLHDAEWVGPEGTIPVCGSGDGYGDGTGW